MQIFEFHFNPKLRNDLIFDSFCYEPENIYEKRLGSLYMVGVLKNVLPQNLQFLDKLFKTIKEKFYKLTLYSPEKSLRETLKEVNEFLEKEAKKGDVSWLGNLNFAVLNLSKFKLNFTKVGEIKIYMIRKGKIIDIDKKLKFQDIEPYPLKIFGKIVSGKLSEDDLILVFTKEVFDFFQKENLIEQIAQFNHFPAKELREILNRKKEELVKVSGILLTISLTKEKGVGKKELITPKIKKEFSFKEALSPIMKLIFFLPLFKKNQKTKIKPEKLPFESWKRRGKTIFFNKKIILVLALIFTLFLGFILSHFERKKEKKFFEEEIKKIEEKLILAENYLLLENPQAQKLGNSLLREVFQEISPLLTQSKNLPKDLSAKTFSLKDKILEKLFQLNKLEEIKEPELIFEFKASEFIPQKLISLDRELYFFSPYVKNLFWLKENGEKEMKEIEEKFSLAAKLNEFILFFSKPSQITIYKDKNRLKTVILEEPYADFAFDDFAIFQGSLYFFDKKTGQIIKYPLISTEKEPHWGKPKLWLKKAVVGKAMAIDGTIWVLEKNNAISKYYMGTLQKKLEIDIFPPVKDFSKIFTSPNLPYLYLLEPNQKRVLLLSKEGELIKQFQSEKFDNLLAFDISEGGKTIYLLNGLKVYKITL